jgi:hypothetical protein
MKLNVIDNELIMTDVTSPKMVVAKFQNITKSAQKMIALNNNFGDDIFALYSSYKGDIHITDVVEFLTKLDKLYNEYELNKFTITR